MSKGLGGKAVKLFEDDSVVIYNYGARNLNIPKYKTLVMDGKITIKKQDMEKSLDEKFDEKIIEIVTCSNCWKKFDKYQVDEISLKLIFKILSEYKKDRKFIEDVAVDY